MKKKKTKRYWLRDGEAIWAKTHFQISCCDCGLKHFVSIDKETSCKKGLSRLEPNRGCLRLRFYREESSTKHNRSKRKYPKK